MYISILYPQLNFVKFLTFCVLFVKRQKTLSHANRYFSTRTFFLYLGHTTSRSLVKRLGAQIAGEDVCAHIFLNLFLAFKNVFKVNLNEGSF
jgi:hypothetical protein